MNRILPVVSCLLFSVSLSSGQLGLGDGDVEKDLNKMTSSGGLTSPDSGDKVDNKLAELDKSIDQEGKTGTAAEEKDSLFSQAKSAAVTAAANVDWQNLSWDKVSGIPYNDKAQLLAWAGSQVDSWRDKLAVVAMDKTKTSLASLGDSGWQGSLKKVVASLDDLRKSNPDTWDAAKGSLLSAWDKFEKEATQYLKK